MRYDVSTMDSMRQNWVKMLFLLYFGVIAQFFSTWIFCCWLLLVHILKKLSMKKNLHICMYSYWLEASFYASYVSFNWIEFKKKQTDECCQRGLERSKFTSFIVLYCVAGFDSSLLFKGRSPAISAHVEKWCSCFHSLWSSR